jgi:hypothetical protein
MASPPLLDVDLLETLLACWVEQDAPILRKLRPGLSDSDIDEIVEPLGITPSHEARVWWGWHDGATTRRPGRNDRAIGRISLRYIPLTEAVEFARRSQEIARKITPGQTGLPADARYWWEPSWLPITPESRGPIVLDCGVRSGQPSPIRRIDHADLVLTHPRTIAEANRVGGFRTPKARSFGELVQWWIEAFDVGAYRYDKGADRWIYEPQRLRKQLFRSGVV